MNTHVKHCKTSSFGGWNMYSLHDPPRPHPSHSVPDRLLQLFSPPTRAAVSGQAAGRRDGAWGVNELAGSSRGVQDEQHATSHSDSSLDSLWSLQMGKPPHAWHERTCQPKSGQCHQTMTSGQPRQDGTLSKWDFS